MVGAVACVIYSQFSENFIKNSLVVTCNCIYGRLINHGVEKEKWQSENLRPYVMSSWAEMKIFRVLIRGHKSNASRACKSEHQSRFLESS